MSDETRAKPGLTYRDAGVDIEATDHFVATVPMHRQTCVIHVGNMAIPPPRGQYGRRALAEQQIQTAGCRSLHRTHRSSLPVVFAFSVWPEIFRMSQFDDPIIRGFFDLRQPADSLADPACHRG